MKKLLKTGILGLGLFLSADASAQNPIDSTGQNLKEVLNQDPSGDTLTLQDPKKKETIKLYFGDAFLSLWNEIKTIEQQYDNNINNMPYTTKNEYRSLVFEFLLRSLHFDASSYDTSHMKQQFQLLAGNELYEEEIVQISHYIRGSFENKNMRYSTDTDTITIPWYDPSKKKDDTFMLPGLGRYDPMFLTFDPKQGIRKVQTGGVTNGKIEGVNQKIHNTFGYRMNSEKFNDAVSGHKRKEIGKTLSFTDQDSKEGYTKELNTILTRQGFSSGDIDYIMDQINEGYIEQNKYIMNYLWESYYNYQIYNNPQEISKIQTEIQEKERKLGERNVPVINHQKLIQGIVKRYLGEKIRQDIVEKQWYKDYQRGGNYEIFQGHLKQYKKQKLQKTIEHELGLLQQKQNAGGENGELHSTVNEMKENITALIKEFEDIPITECDCDTVDTPLKKQPPKKITTPPKKYFGYNKPPKRLPKNRRSNSTKCPRH